MHLAKRYVAASAIAASLMLVGACAPTQGADPGSTADADSETGAEVQTIDVGVIYSRTGPLAGYGEQYLTAFEAGLDYATDGTNIVGDYEINLEIVDDAGDPNKAVNAFKDMVGSGIPLIVGTAASGVALQVAPLAEQNQTVYIVGPAAVDTVTGINGYTFRSGRQTYQDVATAGTFLDSVEGANVAVFAQDNAFGQGNAATVEAVLGGSGATVTPILVGESVTDFTGEALKILDAEPDLLFVAWAGETTAAMWQALEQQGVMEATTVVTGLADTASYQAYGPASDRINFLNHYFAGAADNDVNTAMIAGIEAAGGVPDLFSPDGFNAALMVVRAIEEGGDDPDAMVAALEGWTFDGPKGEMTIRPGDHALIQPMFQVRLVDEGGTWVPELIETVAPDAVAPPEAG
ncbi:substrate-binding domain-containing protein [Occultella kanbiaonis]|uniref:substrate-binding domain-containing protein n=1 Tax=Occultella kanbiaonis TaxID=2675754 RepID=UPI0013D7CD4E|nr:substrate-binding domain-containing protein [Occultella kanbiaonis]